MEPGMVVFPRGILPGGAARRAGIGCLTALLLVGWTAGWGAEESTAAAVDSAPPDTVPILFLGTAYAERLSTLKDLSRWPTVAAHAGLFVHPDNINKNSPQLEILKDVAPLFGLRQAVIERNALPEADDIKYRMKLMRDTFRFTEGLYFYFNGIAKGTLVDGQFVITPPAPEWSERARQVAALGGMPLFGPAPHNLCRPPDGWNNPGWDYLRDFSSFKGFCFDAPAELYVREGKNETHGALCRRYRESVVESIRYARANGGKTIYLLGAHGTAAQNVEAGRQVVRDLKSRDALPWAWGIEDYTRDSDLPMVPERNPDGSPAHTVTGLALWILDFYAGRTP
jgi:hypothetical protein